MLIQYRHDHSDSRFPTPDSHLKPHPDCESPRGHRGSAPADRFAQTKLRSFKEWRRDAPAAIYELSEQMLSSHFREQDSR
jgi:hypothetical protein